MPAAFSPLLVLTQTSVAGGYVVALTLVVLLQYVHSVTRQERIRSMADRFRREVDGLSIEVLQLNRDRNLQRLENQILREVLSQTECSKAISQLLRRFVTNSDEAFAMVMPLNPVSDLPVLSRGLQDTTVRAIKLDLELVAALSERGAVLWERPTVTSCPILAVLTPSERKKARHVFAIAIADELGVLAVLITSSLLPIAAPRSEQIELTTRLMSSIAPNLRQTLELQRQSAQLKCTREMLELRSIVDGRYQQPSQMLERFLGRLSQLVNADRATLFLPSSDPSGERRVVVRAGAELQPGVADIWLAHEQMLASVGNTHAQLSCFDSPQLCRLGVDTLIGSAATLPLLRDRQSKGIICITRRNPGEFTSSQKQILDWSGETLTDAIERVMSFHMIERQARQDGLTELANRRTFDSRLAHELQELRTGAMDECSLMLLDLDRFKSINDVYGHQAGDEVLREAARVLREQVSRVRQGDRVLLARYGGEEMAILLPGIGVSGAARIAEGIRAALERHVIMHNGTAIRVTISIGVAAAPDHSTQPEGLVAAADAALYRAKSGGRNAVMRAESNVESGGLGDLTKSRTLSPARVS